VLNRKIMRLVVVSSKCIDGEKLKGNEKSYHYEQAKDAKDHKQI